jgi:hypothetical protein
MQPYIKRALYLWIPIALTSTALLIASYAIQHQAYRQGASDPQIQLAEDAAGLLAKGLPFTAFSTPTPLELERSLGTWIAVYNAQGEPLASTGTVKGDPIVLPKGLFDPKNWKAGKRFDAPTGPETRLTWQPEKGSRQAVVLVQYTQADGQVGYVTSGRSMRLVEERIAALMEHTFVAWILTLAATYATFVLLLFFGWL